MVTPAACIACSRPLPAQARFCPECGVRVEAEVGEEGPPLAPARLTPPREERRARGISVAMLAIVATVFAVVGVSDALLAGKGGATWATTTGLVTAVLWVLLMIALIAWTLRSRRGGSREART